MSDEEILRLWRVGLTIKAITKEYRNKFNGRIKDKSQKITTDQAMSYVEKSIYEYETRDWVRA